MRNTVWNQTAGLFSPPARRFCGRNWSASRRKPCSRIALRRGLDSCGGCSSGDEEIPEARRVFAGGSGSRCLGRQSDTQAAHRKTSPLLVRRKRTASHCQSDGLLVPVRAHALVCHRRNRADEGKPKIWLCSDSARGAHRVFKALSLRSFPD